MENGQETIDTTIPAVTEVTEVPEVVEVPAVNDSIDYSDAINELHGELVSLNEAIQFQNELFVGVNDIYIVLMGVLIGGFISSVILKGLFKNA